MKQPPVEIKRVEQGSPRVSDAMAYTAKVRDTAALFLAHNIGVYWKPAVSHTDNAHRVQIKWADDSLDVLLQTSFDYALGKCLADPWMKHSGAINEDQTQWFKAFGKRPSAMLAINPIDKILEYDKYFGNNIKPGRIIYSDTIPSGNVLCLNWSKNNYIDIGLIEGDDATVWVEYYTQMEFIMLSAQEDNLESELAESSKLYDSMLVNIRNLAGVSVLDGVLNGLI